MIGDVWEWTSSDFGGYPGFVAYPYREYSEVFFGADYRVLRGGSWATRARVATPTFRNWDYPQRRQIFAGFRIARDAAMKPLLDDRRDPDRVVALGGRRALARQRRARRPDAAVQGAAAQALLRRARLGAVRADLRAARVLPDAHRARDPRPTRADEIVAAHRRRRAGRARLGRGRRRRGSCSTRWRAPGTLQPLRPARRLRARRAGRGRRSSSTSTTGSRSTAWSATSSATSTASPSGDGAPRLVALLGGTIGNFPPGTRRAAAARDRRAARPRRPAAARHRPGQGPGA